MEMTLIVRRLDSCFAGSLYPILRDLLQISYRQLKYLLQRCWGNLVWNVLTLEESLDRDQITTDYKERQLETNNELLRIGWWFPKDWPQSLYRPCKFKASIIVIMDLVLCVYIWNKCIQTLFSWLSCKTWFFNFYMLLEKQYICMLSHYNYYSNFIQTSSGS